MSGEAQELEQRVARKDAEMLVRGWNLLFNRCLSYSFQHPMVQESLVKIYGLFASVQRTTGSFSVLLQEAMFFVDSVDVMYQPQNRRIADHLRRFGVESITFPAGFSLQDFSVFVDACALIHPDAASFAAYVSGHGVSGLEVNKVSLRAVKEGEEMVPTGSGRQGGSGGLPLPEGGGNFQSIVARAVVGRLTAQEIEGNVLLAQLLAQPDSLGKAVIEETTGGNGKGRAEDVLLGVLSQFAQSSRSSEHSLEELMAGIYSMRSEMLGLLKAQKALDTTLQEEDIQASADEAFIRTVCQIASDDWRRSKGNAKRLATVLTRVVPGRKELRTLLPRLKDSFLAMGVTLQQWYGLISEITNLFGIEKAMDKIAEVAGEFGVTPDEILGELQRDPQATARILLASAEIRRIGGGDAEERMIQSLLDAVDQTGERLADSLGKDPQGAVGAVRSFEKLRKELEQEISAKGDLDPALRQAALKKLELRSQHSISDLKARAFASQLENPDLSKEEKDGLLDELAGDENEIDAILGTALSLVGENEVARQIAQEVVARVREKKRLEREKKAGSSLPSGIYPRSVAEFFLRFELKRAHRYGFGFTCMLVSFQGLPEDPEVLKTHEAQLRGLANTLSADLSRLLREVDFVGHFGYNRLFVVLPMTSPPNDLPVLKKLRDHLSCQVALPSGGKAWVRPRVGVVAVAGGQKMSLQEVYEAASRKWQEDL